MTDPSIQDTDSQVQQLIDTGTTELRKDVIGAQKECTYNPHSRLYNSHSQQFSNMEDTVALHRDNMVLVKPEDEQEQGIALLNDSHGKKSKFRDERENQLREVSEKGQQLNECNEEDATGRFIPEGGLQHQASIVHWERFLPKQQLRVLLVEDDDSTRHVVCTLLRNCSYEVTCAVNGMEAWGLLENRNYHFDLVLTEVAMPYLSGIGLLANIMGHEDCKRIPVIMMSSHDSMGVVFKCLSKGAVDFLVKPVRKNELKTLWQHVWRRCHSSGGNGSGSGSQAQKALGIDCRADSPSNDDTNNGSDNDSSDLNNQDGSDNASGTQGSWTKKARQEGILQVECQATYIQRQYSKMPGSEELQREGIQDHTVAEKTGIETSLKEEHILSDFGRKGILLSTSSGGKENKAGADAGKGGPVEDSTIAIDLNGQIAYEMVIKRDKKDIGMEDISLQRSTHESPESKNNIVSDLRLTPVLKLTLKRCCQGEEEQGETDKRQSLRHSYPSAFSRYNNSPKSTTLSSSGFSSINAYSIPSVSTGHSFMQGTGIKTTNLSAPQPAMHAERNCFTKGACEILLSPPKVEVKSDKLGQLPEHSPTNTLGKDEAVPFLSIPQHLSVPPLPPGIWTYNELPTPYSPVFFSNPTVQYWSSSPEVVSRLNSSDQRVQQNPPALHPQVYYNHGNQHHHVQHHNQQHSSQLSLGSQQKKDQTVSNLGRRASLGSLSMELLEDESSQTWDGDGQGRNANLHGNTINGNGSVNRSATGSNNPDYGIYGQSNNQSDIQTVDGENGDSTAQNGADVAELGNEITANTASNEGVLGTQQNSSTRREAALTKFRQKRKERCFEKKVRYQSRKRLAEQRPRVRGQFVRQSVYRFTEGEAL